MRTFITKTTFFILPILVIVLSMEILLRNIPNGYLYKKEYLDKHSTEIETLILGSSYSFYGLNPDYFTNTTFNASYVSQTLNYDYEILKKYQNSLDNLKTIILPISYFTLYAKLEEGVESWRVKNYVIYYGIDKKSFYDNFEVTSNQQINLKRLYSYYILGHKDLTYSNLGWGTTYKSENAKNLVETGKTTAKRHTRDNIYSEKNTTIFNENKLHLKQIIKICRERNVKLLLFTPPAFETYRHNINIEQYNTTIETVTKIASQCDNCIYVNLFDDTSFVAKDFYDADHLSEIGAEKLSKLIDEKINEWK